MRTFSVAGMRESRSWLYYQRGRFFRGRGYIILLDDEIRQVGFDCLRGVEAGKPGDTLRRKRWQWWLSAVSDPM